MGETVDHDEASSIVVSQVAIANVAVAVTSTPHQPTNLRKTDTSTRSIRKAWYEKHLWISVCTSSYAIFYRVCCSAKQKGLLSFPKHPQIPFVEGGFTNWKKALQGFQSHEKSSVHKEAISTISSIARGVNIAALLSKEKEAELRYHRDMLLKLLFLARQGLPFRGHKEESESMEGNLYQLLLLQLRDSLQLASWLKK